MTALPSKKFSVSSWRKKLRTRKVGRDHPYTSKSVNNVLGWLQCLSPHADKKSGACLSVLTVEDVLKLSQAVTFSAHWYVDLSDGTVFWSDEVYRIHGHEPGSFQPDVTTGINSLSPLRPPTGQTNRRAFDTNTRTNGFQGSHCSKGGAIRRVHAQGKVTRDQQGQSRFLFGVFTDITDEWFQQHHHHRLAAALENTGESIIVTDAEGHTTWTNGAFTRLTGFSQEEIRGRKPGELLQGPDTDPETIEYMGAMRLRAQPFTTEALNYHKEGRRYWVRISCQPDFDEDFELLGFVAIQTDITEEKNIRLNLQREIELRKSMEEQLRYIATHDELSGMPNRRHFLQQADLELNRCHRYSRPLSIFVVDLDHFKTVNDRHGHAAGDAVIQAFARLCERTLRRQDIAARVGGEEFAVLLPETSLEDACVLAERLRQKLAAQPLDIEGKAILITASIGVMESAPSDTNILAMLARADKALYQAKEGGRNQVVSTSAY
jgi:diguanylate cyclase (GGDEF)-like protein/PAS domain S-box-containing protein